MTDPDHSSERSAVTPEQVREIERACEQLSVAYARAVDFRDQDAFVELFSDDGMLHVGEPLNGREAIAAAVARRPEELR
jgi:uncharacterized protein (TIGR02246 family)